LINHLIKLGANVDEQDHVGRTALHIAAQKNNISVVEDLIEANALANVRSKDGSTPLHVK